MRRIFMSAYERPLKFSATRAQSKKKSRNPSLDEYKRYISLPANETISNLLSGLFTVATSSSLRRSSYPDSYVSPELEV